MTNRSSMNPEGNKVGKGTAPMSSKVEVAMKKVQDAVAQLEFDIRSDRIKAGLAAKRAREKGNS